MIEEEIRDILLNRYPTAVRSRNAEEYVALFASDVTYIPFDGPECHSKEQIAGFYNAMKKQFGIDPTLKIEKVNIYDDLENAYVIGKSFAKMTPTNSDPSMEMVFRAFWIFTKEAGKWKIARQLWNIKP